MLHILTACPARAQCILLQATMCNKYVASSAFGDQTDSMTAFRLKSWRSILTEHGAPPQRLAVLGSIPKLCVERCLRQGEFMRPPCPSTADATLAQVVNPTSTDENMTFSLGFGNVANFGTLQLLHGPPNSSNTPENPDLVTPQKSTIMTGKTFNYTAPSYSLSVITVNAH